MQRGSRGVSPPASKRFTNVTFKIKHMNREVRRNHTSSSVIQSPSAQRVPMGKVFGEANFRGALSRSSPRHAPRARGWDSCHNLLDGLSALMAPRLPCWYQIPELSGPLVSDD